MALDFLDSKHPIYIAWTRPAPYAGASGDGNSARPLGEAAALLAASSGASGDSGGAWQRNMRRLRGGDEVLLEIRPFAWEPPGSGHYESRVAQATYINFPDLLATAMVGHLFRSAPLPGKRISFGSLGEVNPTDVYNPDNPSPAEQVWYNVNGASAHGAQWNDFWQGVATRSMATGHRWMMVESPTERPATREDEIRGARPYIVEWDNEDVTNWYFARTGDLDFLIIRPRERDPQVDASGALKGNEEEPGYLLLVRRGCRRLGDEFAGGGWWRFSPDKTELGHGTWDSTNGVIPAWVHFYQSDTGSRTLPALSRPAITELGQAAVAYMNLSSARDFDAWDAATSITYLLGVDVKGFNLAVEKIQGGNRIIPVPADPSGKGGTPSVSDGSMGAVTGTVFDTALKAKREEAAELAAREATGEATQPGESGAAKVAGFNEIKAPRLALMAGEMERSQNIALHFLALRWGRRPDAFVSWPREFDITPLVDDIREMFELQDAAQLRSATLGALLLTQAIKEKGLAPTPEEFEIIQGEWQEDALQQAEARERETAVRGATEDAFGAGG